MTAVFKVTALVATLLVVGCQSVPEPVADGPVCPEPRVPECPRCEIFECPEPRVLERYVVRPAPPPPAADTRPRTGGELDLPIIGVVEYVHLESIGLRLEGLMDTAEELTILQATDIQLVEKDGQRHVQYRLTDPATEEVHPMDSTLRRRATLSGAGGDSLRAYVVMLWLVLGDTRTKVEVALVEREEMPYPLRVGRNLLTDVAIVDVSQRHTQDTP